jgi:uncharacterized protein (DUF305 family)
MDRMMAAMNVAPTGDVDADFVAMMVPHHRGAVEMAEAVLSHGRNEFIRRIAQEIVVVQLQEIEAMHRALITGSAMCGVEGPEPPLPYEYKSKGHGHAP